MAEPLTDEELDTADTAAQVVGANSDSVSGDLLAETVPRLIAELRALRKAAWPFAWDDSPGFHELRFLPRLRELVPEQPAPEAVPPPPVVALDGSGERG